MTTIGLATERAAAGIAKVYVDTWRSTYAAVLPHRMLLRMSYERQAREWSWIIRNRADAQPVIVAADADRDVIGFTSFGLSRPGNRPAGGRFAGDGNTNVGEIHTLYVLPEFQERGIGRRLLSAAFAAMLVKGYDCSFLWVLRDNPSRYFYERVGGKAVAERRERLWGCTLDEICYGWPDLRGARHSDR
ncbi:GNAT family N-acetyltransferase [Dongia deserti]|uniref:GNAT family N-acetyltransferase n=1 Tax=Dongia deserti TaxID=2268030 RepID=UPI000E65669B|nr:GNAT family N-acetyltransferase [Dongia deserti]